MRRILHASHSARDDRGSTTSLSSTTEVSAPFSSGLGVGENFLFSSGGAAAASPAAAADVSCFPAAELSRRTTQPSKRASLGAFRGLGAAGEQQQAPADWRRSADLAAAQPADDAALSSGEVQVDGGTLPPVAAAPAGDDDDNAQLPLEPRRRRCVGRGGAEHEKRSLAAAQPGG